MDEIVLRIKELMSRKQLSATEFADQIGVQKASISHILSGRNKPSLDFILKICERYKDVDVNSLLFGKTLNPDTIESDNLNEGKLRNGNINISETEKSQNDIEKIIILYTDKSFKEYKPNEST